MVILINGTSKPMDIDGQDMGANKLTTQETKIINYLQSKNNTEVAWEELAQFAKDPQNVKRKTVQKSVSEIKRKYTSDGLAIPFNVKFISLLDIAESTPLQTEQKLVQIKKTTGGNMMIVNEKKNIHQAQVDFVLDPSLRRVRTREGLYQLNDNEWYMMEYFNRNIGRLITLSELRDKVVYPNYGSKLPARWFNSIMSIINNLRRQVPGLDKRILTVKSNETSYLYQ
jgi:hypothetical protein